MFDTVHIEIVPPSHEASYAPQVPWDDLHLLLLLSVGVAWGLALSKLLSEWILLKFYRAASRRSSRISSAASTPDAISCPATVMSG